MHSHNQFYGQQEVLAQFAGAVDHAHPPAIPGHLQHCWDLTQSCPGAASLPPGMPSLVWSTAAQHRTASPSGPYSVAIGAPWLYLLRRPADWLDAVPSEVYQPEGGEPGKDGKSGKDERSAAEREADCRAAYAARQPTPAGTLWFPQHGLHGAHLAQRLAGDIARTEDGPVTVMLTEPDHHVEQIRSAYRGEGHKVVAMGHRRREPGRTGPGLLERMLHLMRRHLRVASNGLHTGLLYGAAAGLLPMVYGTAPEQAVPVSPGPARDLLESGKAGAAQEIAEAELGRDALLTPEELSVLFDWTHRG